MTKDAWKRFSDEGYKHYRVVEAGFKYNMTDIQAAIGIHQLKRIETYWERRRIIWNRYREEFQNLPLTIPTQPPADCRHGYHLFILRISKAMSGISRDDFLDAMTRNNIGVGVHYLSIPEHPYYQQRFGWKPRDYPHAMNLGRETVSLPFSPKLSDEDVNDVIAAVRNIF
jgi:dTDP-4-amino-4,6-dideoxygalactose transaminase